MVSGAAAMRWPVPIMLLLGLIALGGAAAQKPQASQTGNAGMNALQDRSSDSPSGALFVKRCGMCHRNFGMGTVILSRRMDSAHAWLERRDDLTSDYVIAAARQGIGNMPRITRGDVSDAELSAIAAYLAKGK